MYCSRCGKELIDGTRFCPNCGKKINTGIEEPNISEQQNSRNDKKISDKNRESSIKVSATVIGIFVALIVLVLLRVISASSYIGKGIRFGMSEDRVSDILSKKLPSQSVFGSGDSENESNAKNKGVSKFGIRKNGQIDEFKDYYGPDITPYVDEVIYHFTDDKLSLVEYRLEKGRYSDGNEFKDMQEACEAFGIKYKKDCDEEDGYYACYIKGIYAEFHPFSESKDSVDREKYYVYFEPTYKLSLFGKFGHKHEWDMPVCDEKKVCKSCEEESVNYRQHILDDMGVCVICGESVLAPNPSNEDYLEEWLQEEMNPPENLSIDEYKNMIDKMMERYQDEDNLLYGMYDFAWGQKPFSAVIFNGRPYVFCKRDDGHYSIVETAHKEAHDRCLAEDNYLTSSGYIVFKTLENEGSDGIWFVMYDLKREDVDSIYLYLDSEGKLAYSERNDKDMDEQRALEYIRLRIGKGFEFSGDINAIYEDDPNVPGIRFEDLDWYEDYADALSNPYVVN